MTHYQVGVQVPGCYCPNPRPQPTPPHVQGKKKCIKARPVRAASGKCKLSLYNANDMQVETLEWPRSRTRLQQKQRVWNIYPCLTACIRASCSPPRLSASTSSSSSLQGPSSCSQNLMTGPVVQFFWDLFMRRVNQNSMTYFHHSPTGKRRPTPHAAASSSKSSTSPHRVASCFAKAMQVCQQNRWM